jgi:hypothetical protein
MGKQLQVSVDIHDRSTRLWSVSFTDGDSVGVELTDVDQQTNKC